MEHCDSQIKLLRALKGLIMAFETFFQWSWMGPALLFGEAADAVD
jgi:hypothetical protein